jgi:hypothetical protein
MQIATAWDLLVMLGPGLIQTKRRLYVKLELMMASETPKEAVIQRGPGRRYATDQRAFEEVLRA